MCLARHMVCCAGSEFGGCGCVSCDEPECWPPEDDEFEDDGRFLNDDEDDDGGVLMPLAACGCAASGRFRCEAVA